MKVLHGSKLLSNHGMSDEVAIGGTSTINSYMGSYRLLYISCSLDIQSVRAHPCVSWAMDAFQDESGLLRSGVQWHSKHLPQQALQQYRGH